MLVPLNWRLAVPELTFIVRDAAVKVLVVEQAFDPAVEALRTALPDVRIVGLDYAPAQGVALAALLQGAEGDGRNPLVDTSSPLLIVYTSGTTGYPKGAVLRQEALVWNCLMEASIRTIHQTRKPRYRVPSVTLLHVTVDKRFRPNSPSATNWPPA